MKSRICEKVKQAAAHPAAELVGHARRRRIKTEIG
jgi:hypothetical protein